MTRVSSFWNAFTLFSALLAGAACGDRGGAPPANTTQAPAAAPDAPAAQPAGGAASVALGDSIFHGQAANGICFTCHGQDAKGTQLAPNLTDGEWLNADGSLESIANVITKGVPQPKKYPGPMPPMGGASLTPEQVNAVAQYVHSLSQKG
jgi:cbb3-type cytochrome c oxidase subunit III